MESPRVWSPHTLCESTVNVIRGMWLHRLKLDERSQEMKKRKVNHPRTEQVIEVNATNAQKCSLARVNSIRKLYVAYNNAFRMLFRLPRDCSASGMFAVNNIMSCPVLVRKLEFGFYKRENSSQNGIVQAIRGSDIWWKSSIRLNWHKLLYVHNAGQGIG